LKASPNGKLLPTEGAFPAYRLGQSTIDYAFGPQCTADGWNFTTAIPSWEGQGWVIPALDSFFETDRVSVVEVLTHPALWAPLRGGDVA